MRKSANDGLPAVDKPSSARIYDYLLGGEHNYAIDRAFADKQVELAPDMPAGMRSNRAFIGRAVRFALERGITQFVDIGAGLPSQGQAHEIADEVAPDVRARVVYIDNEEIAHAHSEILLDGEADPDRHKAVFADFFDSEELWEQVLDSGVINPDEPTCLLITAILHFMFPEQEPEKALAYYRHQLAPGSLLVLSHISDGLDDKNTREVVRNYSKTTSPACLRTPDEIAEFFGNWELVEPGLAWAPEWRPDGTEQNWWGDAPARARYMCGMAAKP
ncbi:SAM-dependent methyltransferase [Amycolatopsis palatopharyngis]|uniref:SAM-dependent methyltransferase n=1 Tax=Amycolatopsis palatopharyngis TaxID=187982 RepID=UPI000E23FBCB|nr:SAM-dependent methyltransferase [Amycolatopsis palatopharyngis]